MLSPRGNEGGCILRQQWSNEWILVVSVIRKHCFVTTKCFTYDKKYRCIRRGASMLDILYHCLGYCIRGDYCRKLLLMKTHKIWWSIKTVPSRKFRYWRWLRIQAKGLNALTYCVLDLTSFWPCKPALQPDRIFKELMWCCGSKGPMYVRICIM